MEQYYEQNVADKRSAKSDVLYALCLLLMGILILAGLLFAANVLETNPDSAGINWLCLLGLAVSLTGAGALFRGKDYLRMEFDYIYHHGALEICAVLNRKRRKQLASIDLQRVQQAGTGKSMPAQHGNLKTHKWFADTCCNYIVYMDGDVRHAALLEMNEEIISIIRSRLPVGAWRNEEGKTSDYASLSR